MADREYNKYQKELRKMVPTLCKNCLEPKNIAAGYVCNQCQGELHRDKIRKRVSTIFKDYVANITAPYIALVLQGKSGLPARKLPLELMRIQKLIIILTRLKNKAIKGEIDWEEPNRITSQLISLLSKEINLRTCQIYGTLYERNSK